MIKKKEIDLAKLDTKENPADICTKSLSYLILTRHLERIGFVKDCSSVGLWMRDLEC